VGFDASALIFLRQSDMFSNFSATSAY